MRPIGLFAAELLTETGQALAAQSGDYIEMFSRGMGIEPSAVRTIPFYTDAPLPAPEELSAVVVTGSLAMVTERLPWAERGAAWLARYADDLPILGVCFGHQLLAHALGGTVEYNPDGPEYGTAEVSLTAAGRADALFGSLPDRAPMQVAHHQRVGALPPGAEVLATGVSGIQAARFGQQAWGVQFHPEFSAADSSLILRDHGASLAEDGLDLPAATANVGPSPAASVMLRSFARIAAGL